MTTFVQVKADEGEEASWRLATLTFNALLVVLGALTLLGILFSPLIVDGIFHGEGFQDVPLTEQVGQGLSNKRDLTVYLSVSDADHVSLHPDRVPRSNRDGLAE